MIDVHLAALWLVNTGWTGGAFATGERISITVTRARISAITETELAASEMVQELVFGFDVPVSVSAVPDEVLRPRDTCDDHAA